MVPDNSARIPRVPAYSGGSSLIRQNFAYRAFTSFGSAFQRIQLSAHSAFFARSYYPDRSVNPSVWALPRSIASTGGIVITFSSCGYLDVSVPRVRSPALGRGDGIAPAGLPHSEIRGYSGYLPLTAAFRSLSRPSSPPRA